MTKDEIAKELDKCLDKYTFLDNEMNTINSFSESDRGYQIDIENSQLDLLRDLVYWIDAFRKVGADG